MRIRNVLLVTFLAATIIPSLFFGWWAYRDGLRSEFSEVEDRHLLLARNVSHALERYYVDLVAAIESISLEMDAGHENASFAALLERLDILAILKVEKDSNRILARIEIEPVTRYPERIFSHAKEFAAGNDLTFTPVMDFGDGRNVLVAVRQHGDRNHLIAVIKTDYFVELGRSISFGVKGHAAIVDQAGNVLAHPLPSWIAQRKNIANISAVQRMMQGQTGIEQFYSPALKGDMIAGITSVPGPGWGVMIPQPVSELYDKILENNRSISSVIGIGILISFSFALLLMNSIAKPLEELIAMMHLNRRSSRLEKIDISRYLLSIRELVEFRNSYNGMVEQIGKANRKAERLAYTDSVTLLPTRAKFQQLFAEAKAAEHDSDKSGILVFLDIDNFKDVNDMYGHDMGDEVLRAFASKLQKVSNKLNEKVLSGTRPARPPKPVVARIGGDEFTILVPGMTDKNLTKWFLDTLLEETSRIDQKLSKIVRYSTSIGCATYPRDGKTLEELMRHADIAMYHAKKRGKNRAQIYDEKIGSMTETEIRSEFARAVEENQLVLEYQPKICTRRKAVAGVEALARWNHPRLGKLSPNVWLPAISGTPLMSELGEWVIERAMRDQLDWQKRGYLLNMAVNVSSEQFAIPTFAEDLKRVSDQLGIKRNLFEIEVTEDALFSNESHAESSLGKLRALGFKISIDDFGKGYSNLARLAQMPLDFIKIDQSLIAGAAINPKVSAILDAAVSIAKRLECKIVAEGIENLEFAEFATNMGANLLQGYYFARSMPSEILLEWLEEPRHNAIERYKRKMDLVAA